MAASWGGISPCTGQEGALRISRCCLLSLQLSSPGKGGRGHDWQVERPVPQKQHWVGEAHLGPMWIMFAQGKGNISLQGSCWCPAGTFQTKGALRTDQPKQEEGGRCRKRRPCCRLPQDSCPPRLVCLSPFPHQSEMPRRAGQAESFFFPGTLYWVRTNLCPTRVWTRHQLAARPWSKVCRQL